MNVLMFGWEFPPNISGGLGTACYGIVKGLSECQDVHITFVIPKSQGNELSANNLQLISADQVYIGGPETKPNITWSNVNFLQVQSKLVPYLTPEIFSEQIQKSNSADKFSEKNPLGIRIKFSGQYGPNLYDEINNYATVAKTIASENHFELIHAHDWLTFPAAVAAKKISGKPLIIHVHSTDYDRSGGAINPDIFAIEKQGMDEADKIIVVSNRIRNRLTEQYNIPNDKIITIYNGIDAQTDKLVELKPQPDKNKIITFLGRITIQKGPEYFVDVARMIIHRMKNVHFVMAGNGEMRNEIIELSARYGISNRFHFTGFLNGPEVTKMLRRSDIFIMPSVSEPFGIVPLEAMQANVPVIISIQSGVSEVIRSVIKTDFWDVHAMADAVHGILKYNKLSKMLIAEGEQEVNKLSWEKPASQIKQVYLNTLSNNAS
jgi:glycosyltransferase involved in cell wall biosynthesis